MRAPVIAATAISHVALRVRDVPRAIAWYRAALGYEVLTDGEAPTPDRTRSAMGLICAGAVALELLETPQGRAHDFASLGVAGLSLCVPDIAEAVASAAAAGLAPTPVIDAEDWKVAFLFDPDRNVVELVQQPAGARTIADFAPTLRDRALAAATAGD